MENLLPIIFSTSFAYSVLRVTTPILFASLAAIISDKAGVINIGLEGIMLFAALMGVISSAFTQSVLIGVLCAVATGVLLSLVLAYFSLNLKSDIILTGIALNLFSSGGTVFLLFLAAQDKGISVSLQSKVVPEISIPLINSIPVLGEILSGHNILTYVSLLCVFLIHLFLYKTPLGLRIRAVGETPNAADSVGISVRRIQYMALMISGALAGLGGAYMSMGYVSWFSRDMTAGRGFIALAAEAMGRGTPLGTFLAAIIFGFADALSNVMQSLRVPAEFVQMIPYVTTILGLVIYSIKQNNKIKKYRRNQV
ncbi:simple sugar transport system permease protein [Anaerovirgula multivorans]|uniref:Simple sugar transport system permease protein n=1 Tax=Anaerovirgula multivorans TaxID=312168 RepID=A0A239FCE5_9FIRM|nr:ABC transporter permease [Anaerovirgula multivorans]SNS54158.1 simple sugar transport system permease protein [Anaerovirgula multivorans]